MALQIRYLPINISLHHVFAGLWLLGAFLANPFGHGLDAILAKTSYGVYWYVERWQEVLRWIQEVVAEIGSDVTPEQLADYVHKTLKSGKVRMQAPESLVDSNFH